MRLRIISILVLILIVGMPVLAQERGEASGIIIRLQVDLNADSNGQVQFWLDSTPERAFHLRINNDLASAAETAMIDVIRDAFVHSWTLHVVYGDGNSIRSVWVQQVIDQRAELPLPAVIPDIEFIQASIPNNEFFIPQDVFPPEVEGATEIEAVPWDAIPNALNDELLAAMIDAALANPTVRRALGDRYAFISADSYLGGDKGVPETIRPYLADGAPVSQLVFFSHANNMTVNIWVQDRKYLDLQTIPADQYQPPEGADELQPAEELARAALGDWVANMVASIILTFPGGRASDESLFFDHRILYVMFAEREGDTPHYYAYVDLTDQKVITYGLIEEQTTTDNGEDNHD